MPEDNKELEGFGEESFADMDSLADFVEIDDLESLEGMEDFVDMVDLDSIPDLDDIPVPDSAEELAEVPMPEDSGSPEDISLSDSIEDLADIPIPDNMEDLADIPIPDNMEDLADIPIPDNMEDLADIPIPDNMEDLADIPIPDNMEDLADISIPEGLEDISIPDSEESPADIAMSDPIEASEEVVKPAEEEEFEDLLALDEFGTSDDMAVPNAASDMDLAGVSVSDAVQESDLDELSGTSETTESGSSLDMMLDGLLDNLDMTGELPDSDQTDTVPEEDLLEIGLPVQDTEQAEEKDPGLLKRLFGNIVTDEIAEAERQAMEDEKEKEALKAEQDAQKKEEKEQEKAVKAEERAAKKAAREKAKAEKKAEKEAKKAEKKAKEEEEAAEQFEVTGKLNKTGVAIIAILTVVFLATEIIGTNVHGVNSTRKAAKQYFDMGKYTQAYQEVLGTKVKEKDPETYEKIKTVMQVQRSINAYNNYNQMNYYPDALNALLRGVQRYDTNLEHAKELEVVSEMDNCREQIMNILQTEFGVSEQEAYSILAMEKEQYTDKVVEIAMSQQ